jgi:hypothetical protein
MCFLLLQTQPDWASIIHFTATGNNCCDYGDRTPGVWFHPGNRQLHIVDGQPSSGNDNCNPSDELPPNVPTTVTIDIGAGFFEVSVSQPGQQPRQVCEGLRKDRRAFQNAHVWAADPWYEPALGTISDFWMQGPNLPRAGCMIDAACNRDYKANRPDGSCIFPQPHMGCNGQPLAVNGATGITQFVPAGQPQRLQQTSHHDIVYMPMDARISFEITPDAQVRVENSPFCVLNFPYRTQRVYRGRLGTDIQRGLNRECLRCLEMETAGLAGAASSISQPPEETAANMVIASRPFGSTPIRIACTLCTVARVTRATTTALRRKSSRWAFRPPCASTSARRTWRCVHMQLA